MQYQKLTLEQKSIRAWRERRNHILCSTPGITPQEAARLAGKRPRFAKVLNRFNMQSLMNNATHYSRMSKAVQEAQDESRRLG